MHRTIENRAYDKEEIRAARNLKRTVPPRASRRILEGAFLEAPKCV